MGRLRAWDTCAEGYTPQQMMALVRWLETKLMQPPPKTATWRRLLQETRRRSKIIATIGALAFLLLFLVLVGILTGVVLEFTKVAAVKPNGVLVSAAHDVSGSQNWWAGVGAAVHLRNVADYPSMPTEDLRRMQDVVLQHKGDFRLYRVAGVMRIMGG